MKPSNLMVSTDGVLKITDFGVRLMPCLPLPHSFICSCLASPLPFCLLLCAFSLDPPLPCLSLPSSPPPRFFPFPRPASLTLQSLPLPSYPFLGLTSTVPVVYRADVSPCLTSQVAEELQRYQHGDATSKSRGSPAFQPPEVASGCQSFSGFKVDVWAAGVSLFLLTTGVVPFSGSSLINLFDTIAKVIVTNVVLVPTTLIAQRLSSPVLGRVRHPTGA